MSNSQATTKVFVVGAGPTGLTLALSLAQNGISVRIIERDPAPHDEQRGPGHSPRTQEIWKFLGVSDDMYEAGRHSLPMASYDENGNIKEVKSPYTDLDEPTPAMPNRATWLIGQEAATRILRAHLQKLGVEVEFGTEFDGFEQHEDHVKAFVKKVGSSVVESIVSEYMVGADGGSSKVRHILGIDFPGETKEDLVWALANVEVHGLGTEYSMSFGKPPAEAVFFLPTMRAITENLFMCALMGKKEDMERANEDTAFYADFVRRVTHKANLDIGVIKSTGLYRPHNIRMAHEFKKGRVFIAGDAAHVHPATGGQGLNTGVQDAFNLAWKLALVLKSMSPISLLETYTEEREPVVKEMLGRTTDMYNKAIDTNRKETFLQRSQVMQQLGVNYRSSSIVVDDFQDKAIAAETLPSAYESDGVLRAGSRAPEAPELNVLKGSLPTNPTTMFRFFRPTYHTVLFFLSRAGDEVSTEITAVLDAFARFGTDATRSVVVYPKGAFTLDDPILSRTNFVVEDTAGHAFEAYGVVEGQPRVVVVRPDGYVGAITRGVTGVKEYIGKIFK